MRVLNISDLHFEWNVKGSDYSKFINENVADVIVLSGDIGVGTSILPFIEHLISLGHQVILVLGNHDYYGNHVDALIDQWRTIANTIPELHFLQEESVVIGEIEFIGATLWTSLGTNNKEEPIDYFVRQSAKKSDDFTKILNWTPELMKERFYREFDSLKSMVKSSNAKYKIVCTHYLPSYQSIHSSYYGHTSNALFATEISSWICDEDIAIWFHGHTHTSANYLINDTYVSCNPLGYVDLNWTNPNFSWVLPIFTIHEKGISVRYPN
jgi:Icc-related predicted phosphoesterase